MDWKSIEGGSSWLMKKKKSLHSMSYNDSRLCGWGNK
jgi:hypothetical protein